MNILETLLNSSEGGALQAAGKQFGLDDATTQALLKNLVPALSGGLKQNVSQAGGLEILSSALKRGNHQKYLDDPATLTDQAAVSDGNGILGHLLGSKEASRTLASRAAESTGLDAGIVKKFLPLVAAVAMGALSKQTGAGAKLGSGSGGALGALGALLDSDGDGQVVDDLLALGKKLF